MLFAAVEIPAVINEVTALIRSKMHPGLQNSACIAIRNQGAMHPERTPTLDRPISMPPKWQNAGN